MLTDYKNLNGKKNNEQQEYEASLKQLTAILTVGVGFYYLLPFVCMLAFGSRTSSLYIYIMIAVYPFYAFISGFLHGKNHGFVWYVPVSVGLMFVPTVFIFQFDPKLMIMGILYCVMGLFGTFTGFLLLKRKQKRKAPIGAQYAVNKYASKKKK